MPHAVAPVWVVKGRHTGTPAWARWCIKACSSCKAATLRKLAWWRFIKKPVLLSSIILTAAENGRMLFQTGVTGVGTLG
ncbi:hypothetical protein AOR02nite_23460 [Acetobacter orientalis]|nr:hypothetical protein AOR02nite_23460 [Acetobacter orientalis]